uniref:Uncharacterized protein n=1 Tax=Babesia bovis TaxID=5865 RepID=S6B3F2_BABBO|nr:conserved hypothetical protein [Babesia bovis]
MSPMNNTFFNIGFSVTGTCVTCLHLTVKKLLPKGRELSYWTLYCHILFAIILSLVSGIMWTIVVIFDRLGPPKPEYSSDASGYPNKEEALTTAAPFFIMLWGCWGFVFFFYPGISPFSILRFCDCQALMYICMCIETCIGLSMYALREYGGIGNKWESNKLGPINLKEGMGNILNNDILKNNSIFSSHVWRSPNFLLWCCFYAGYITVATIFILTMHYPDGVIGKIFLQRKFFIYPMTMFLVFTGNISMNLCWNAVWGNMIGEKGSHNGDRGLVMTILGLGELLILLSSKILSEGYLRSFRAGKAAVESGLPYPTDKMGFVSSFFYWVQRGVVGGSKVFVGVFTTDVRTKVMV